MRKTVLLFLLCAFCGATAHAEQLGGLHNITTTNSTLPVFRDGKLQALFYGAKMTHSAGVIHIQKPVIDLIRSGVNIDLVKSGPTEGYPLRSPLAAVYRFWLPRLVFSEGVIFSDTAAIDQKSRRAHGEDKVFFRSPALDLDGVGFQADFDKRQVLVKKDVRIIIRNGESDIRKAVEKKRLPARDENMEARSEQMLIDANARTVTLLGNVEVDQADNTITCDKMTIYLVRDGEEPDGDTGPVDASVNSGEISRIVCTGNVRFRARKRPSPASPPLSGRNEPAGILLCAGTKTLAEKEKNPLPTTISSDSSDLDFSSDVLTFRGHVEVRDPRLDVDCDALKVHLVERDEQGRELPKGKKGRKGLRQIVCSGNVKATESRVFLYGDEAVLTFREAKKDGHARGKGMFNSDSTELEKIRVVGNLRMVSRPENDPKRDRSKPVEAPSTLTAEEGTMLFSENRADFVGNVHVDNPKFQQESELLTLYAIDTAKAAAQKDTARRNDLPDSDEPPDPNAGLTDAAAPKLNAKISDNLELDRIVAEKSVKISQKTEDGSLRFALGEHALFPARENKVYLTGTEEKPPRLIDRAGEFIRGDTIVVDLARGAMHTTGRGTFRITPQKR